MLLHTGGTAIPLQVTAVTMESGHSVLKLPFDTIAGIGVAVAGNARSNAAPRLPIRLMVSRR